MRVVSASNNGLVKLYDHKTQKTECWGKQATNNEITELAWRNPEEDQLLVGFKNGLVQTTDLKGTVLSSFNLGNPVTSLRALDQDKVLTSDSLGNITIFNQKTNETTKHALNRPVEKMLFSSTLVRGCQTSQGNPIGAEGRCLVLGGEKRLSQIYDLQEQKVIWTAKNVQNDFLDLQVPIHDRDAAWIDPQHTFAMVTAHHHIRTYDIRDRCKPTATLEHTVADTIGNFRLHDRRKDLKVAGKYKGFAGGIRSIQFHPTEPLVAAVGLDRHLRVFDSKTRKLVVKTYLKQRLNKTLFATQLKIEESDPEDLSYEDSGSFSDDYLEFPADWGEGDEGSEEIDEDQDDEEGSEGDDDEEGSEGDDDEEGSGYDDESGMEED